MAINIKRIGAGNVSPERRLIMNKQYQDEAAARADRDAMLAASDWTQLPDAETRITRKCIEDYQRYRRDVYAAKHQTEWPLSVDWPDVPVIERQEDQVSTGELPEALDA